MTDKEGRRNLSVRLSMIFGALLGWFAPNFWFIVGIMLSVVALTVWDIWQVLKDENRTSR
jgi:hypothetical protein